MTLADIEAHGLMLRLAGDRIGVTPSERLTPEWRQYILDNRQSILLRLIERDPPTEAELQLEADERDAIQNEHRYAP